MEQCSGEHRGLSSGDSGMDEGASRKGGGGRNGRGSEDVRGKMRRVIGDLECVLGELRTVVGDLQTLVTQIDVVTTKIDRQCTPSVEEGTASLRDGRRQLSAPALDPLPTSPPPLDVGSITRSVSHSSPFFLTSTPSKSMSSNDKLYPGRQGTYNALKVPGAYIPLPCTPPHVRPQTAGSNHSRGSKSSLSSKDKSSDKTEHFANKCHTRTHSDGDPFFTTSDLNALLTQGNQTSATEYEDPLYVSTKVIKPRNRHRHKVSNTPQPSVSPAWADEGTRLNMVSPSNVSHQSSPATFAASPKLTQSSQQNGYFRKPPPVPTRNDKAPVVSSKVSTKSPHYLPSQSYLIMDHRGNNPKYYENLAKAYQLSKACKDTKSMSSSRLGPSSKVENCQSMSDVDLDLWQTRERGERSTAESTLASSGQHVDLDPCGQGHATPCSPGPSPELEYCGVYEKQLEDTLELALAADTLEMYDTLDDTESLPLGMEAQHARYSVHESFLSDKDLRNLPPQKGDSLGMSDEHLTESNDSMADDFENDDDDDSDDEDEDEDNDGDDECDYDCDKPLKNVMKNGDLLQNLLPGALNHRNVSYSWRTVVDP